MLLKDTKNNSTKKESEAVVKHLQAVLVKYLEEHPNLSLNGLSYRCDISEATLRRIKYGTIKTTPTVKTVIDLLSKLSKEKEIKKLIELYPGPLGSFLKERFSALDQENANYSYDEVLNNNLKDTTSYLVYKMAANRTGVSRDNLEYLFGATVQRKLDLLLRNGLLIERGGVLHAKTKSFSLSNDLFVENFKATADFIRSDKSSSMKRENIFCNFSESVNREAYDKILEIKKEAIQKIVQILNDDTCAGDIPVFVLDSVDQFPTQKEID